MHRLRTCAARLRPLTASQAAQTIGQQQPITACSTGATRTFQPIRCYSAPVASEPFLNGTSSNYVEEMYYAWLENPKSVHKVRSRSVMGPVRASSGHCVVIRPACFSYWVKSMNLWLKSDSVQGEADRNTNSHPPVISVVTGGSSVTSPNPSDAVIQPVCLLMVSLDSSDPRCPCGSVRSGRCCYTTLYY